MQTHLRCHAERERSIRPRAGDEWAGCGNTPPVVMLSESEASAQGPVMNGLVMETRPHIVMLSGSEASAREPIA
ncbi:MAG: hypothetical protein LLG42_02650 [Chloroflexi bacterium]|nr:hypothetical protein [Chloroflexota bacterium]